MFGWFVLCLVAFVHMVQCSQDKMTKMDYSKIKRLSANSSATNLYSNSYTDEWRPSFRTKASGINKNNVMLELDPVGSDMNHTCSTKTKCSGKGGGGLALIADESQMNVDSDNFASPMQAQSSALRNLLKPPLSANDLIEDELDHIRMSMLANYHRQLPPSKHLQTHLALNRMNRMNYLLATSPKLSDSLFTRPKMYRPKPVSSFLSNLFYRGPKYNDLAYDDGKFLPRFRLSRNRHLNDPKMWPLISNLPVVETYDNGAESILLPPPVSQVNPLYNDDGYSAADYDAEANMKMKYAPNLFFLPQRATFNDYRSNESPLSLMESQNQHRQSTYSHHSPNVYQADHYQPSPTSTSMYRKGIPYHQAPYDYEPSNHNTTVHWNEFKRTDKLSLNELLQYRKPNNEDDQYQEGNSDEDQAGMPVPTKPPSTTTTTTSDDIEWSEENDETRPKSTWKQSKNVKRKFGQRMRPKKPKRSKQPRT